MAWAKLEEYLSQPRLIVNELEKQRQVLDMLNITVWLDGETVEVTGTIDLKNAVIATTPPLTSTPPSFHIIREGGQGDGLLNKRY